MTIISDLIAWADTIEDSIESIFKHQAKQAAPSTASTASTSPQQTVQSLQSASEAPTDTTTPSTSTQSAPSTTSPSLPAVVVTITQNPLPGYGEISGTRTYTGTIAVTLNGSPLPNYPVFFNTSYATVNGTTTTGADGTAPWGTQQFPTAGSWVSATVTYNGIQYTSGQLPLIET